MKNILFYYTCDISPSAGGVERVASLQYYELSRKGYKIYTIYGIKQNFDNPIPEQYQLPFSKQLNAKGNMDFIRTFLEQKHINLVLNFAAIFNKSSVCVVDACKKTGVPIISVLHNTLECTLWKVPLVKSLMKCDWGKRIAIGALKIAHRFPFYKGGLYIYRYASATVVLSPCYIDEYKRIITHKASNIYSIYNPLSIPTVNDINWAEKCSIALFVGRLEKQKSVDKLLRIWAKLNEPSWKLYIVGTGSQEKALKQLAYNLGISHSVLFEGHKSPLPYYKQAKLFCLTSIYEGYPMTLIECQSYGVVPVIYDSFPAANDIITPGKNGVVVPAFNENVYVEKMRALMRNKYLLQQMSKNSLEASGRYLTESIIKQWVFLIEKYSH